MRHLMLFALLVVLAGGCSKKKPSEPADPAPGDPKADAPADTTARDRAYWLNDLKSTNPEKRKTAAEELGVWVETDPESVTGLLELLKDKSTTGGGKILPTRVNSTREAAALALSRGGPKGEAALKEKGFALLRDGLNEPDAAIREHTAYTVGTLGPLARPLSPDVMKLCTSPDANVRGTAFDALRSIGITDPVGLVALLKHDNREVVRLAAELIPLVERMPKAAVDSLADAMTDADPNVRRAAAEGLGTAGPDAAAALPKLVAAIKKEYPEQTPGKEADSGPVYAYWDTLVRIGEPAAEPTAKLLEYPNWLAKMSALEVLGEIGPPAKPHVAAIKNFLTYPNGSPGVRAAYALIRIGESRDEALDVFKRAIETSSASAYEAIRLLPALGELGKPLVPLAVAQLSSKELLVRHAVLELIATFPPTEAAKHAATVGRLATDPSDLVRRSIGPLLERLGPDAAPAAESLARAIPAEEEATIREQFVDALLAMGPKAKPALPVLLSQAAEPARLERRAHVFAGLVGVDPTSKDIAALLLGALNEPDAGVRVSAAGAVAGLDPIPPDALAKLVAIARTDKTTSGRLAALRALVAAGGKAKAVKADIEKIAADKLPEFALLAKVAVAAIDGDVSKAAADVRAALGDKNAQVRAVAVESLLLVGPTAADLPALLRLMKEPGGSTKEAAVVCLGRLGPAAKDAVPQLTRLLDDREGNVRAAAARALGEIGTPAALPAVEKLKKLRGDARLSDPQAGPAARRALEKLGVGEKE